MKKIPLWLAIIININIVVGGAFFIAAPKIAAIAGSFAPLTWIICGALIFPIVYSLSKLARRYPFAGGVYVYAQRNFGHFAGVISGWGYFLGAAAANAALIHVFNEKVFAIFDLISFSFKPNFFFLDILVSCIFAATVACGIRMLKPVQIALVTAKSWPFILILISVLTKFFSGQASSFLAPAQSNWIISAVDIVVFAYLGIEAVCSIVEKIENPEKNGFWAIQGSFFVIVAIYSLAQWGLNFSLESLASSKDSFEILASQICSNKFFVLTIPITIALSYIGGAYSMFYANNWNLYAIFHDEKKQNSLTKLNCFGEPSGSVVIQTLMMLCVFIFLNNIDLMIALSDVGTLIALSLSSFAFGIVFYGQTLKQKILSWAVAITALTCCIILNTFIIKDLVNHFGFIQTFFVFTTILIPAIGIYFYQRYKLCCK